MCTITDVKKGEELLSLYGQSTTVLKRSGINHDGLTFKERSYLKVIEDNKQQKQLQSISNIIEVRSNNGKAMQEKLKKRKAMLRDNVKKSLLMPPS